MALKIKTIDISLYVIPVIFLVTSVAVIYSLVLGTPDTGLALKQGLIGMLGLVLLAAASFSDYRFFKGASWIFYVLSIILLVAVELFGKTQKGATNWLDLGFFQLQPSEIAKAFIIFSLAAYFTTRIGKIEWKDIGVSALMVSVPLGLILKEPDLGTALVIAFIYIVMLLMAKPTKVQIAVIGSLVLLAGSSIFLAAYDIKPFKGMLKDYQQARIKTFINPELDPYGRGYNVRQAQISVGSGGLMGRGLGRGSQSQLQFLPEPHTDFIFAGIAESFGFLGSSVFLALYLYLIVRIMQVAYLAQDNFGMLLSFGVAAMFLFQVVINVGMNLGVTPVTGIPLPLLSSGGTSLIVSLFVIGIVQSVYIRHKKISF